MNPTLYRTEITMPKGQRSSKEVKKPKKDTSPPKPMSLDPVRPTVTTVVPDRSKKKA
ncbi:hypothetical protein [Sphaerotilus sp.]|jgi:hypothetical protein|uniref:hypothetical protein n=1 Tax=Sphaerotilus sp. TaxID=2093942 RepID=UPI0025D28AF5|nr:hypothetical protein [Sphaerotilus sp.]